MMKITLAMMVLVACAVQIHGAVDEDVETEWEKFQAHFPMNFKNNEDAERRKANFAKTHADIVEHQKNNPTFEMDFNKFSVMDDEEKKKYISSTESRPEEGARYISAAEFSLRQVPASLDYRTHRCIQPVKNQGSCGSCWAFSATAVVEFGKCIKTGTKVALSEQQLVDCDTTNSGCNGGLEDKAWKFLAKTGYQTTSASYPYTAVRGNCKQTTATKGAVVSTTSPVTYIAAGSTAVDTMKKTLANQQLLSVGIAVVDSFFNYKSGVYTANNCNVEKDIRGYHAITVVGYGNLNGVDFWVIRNSWGSGWGAAGYVLFQRGKNLCKVEQWAVATTIIG